MKTREEIEANLKLLLEDNGNLFSKYNAGESMLKHQVELLLDIKDLLTNKKF